MGSTDDATDTAAVRLQQLHQHFREHPVTGPEGHSYTAFQARTPTVTSPSPLDLEVVDYIGRAIDEVVEHTRTANPDAGPLPPRVADVYQWCREHTQYADGVIPRRTAVIETRHRLEHAVRAGDGKVVRPLRCPSCRTVGLLWQPPIWRAVCVNRHCARRNGGVSRKWTLARLAYDHVTSQEFLNDCAT